MSKMHPGTLRLFKPVALGNRIDGWSVCWIGGWDKCRVLLVVMVERPRRFARRGLAAANAGSRPPQTPRPDSLLAPRRQGDSEAEFWPIRLLGIRRPS